VNAQFYNGSQLEFGKNRIQYKPLDWSFYRYDRFDVFFYAGGKELSHRTAKIAQSFIPELENRFDYTLQNRLQLLIFDRLSDLKQSNVGIDASLANNLGGVTRQVGNKILLYNENGTVGFVKQVQAGIAEALVNEFLFGNDFRERLRSATLLNIPEWYLKGLVAWLSNSWDSEIENQVRDGIISGRYMQFNRLTGEDAIMAGHSIWRYIADTYGEKVIPEIIEVTRINRSVESGFQYVLGIGLKGINQEWLNYYDKKYFYNDTLFSKNTGNLRSGKYRQGYLYRQPQISPDGNSVAWVRNDHGKNTVWLAPFEGGKNRKLFKSGRKLPNLNDQSFPQLAWYPTGELLVYSDEFKGRLRLNFYNINTKKTERKFINQLEKVISMDVSPNGQQIALTGISNGKTDLFIFTNAANTLQPITQDFWDEAHPRWLADGKSIIFDSNRPNDSLSVQVGVPLIPISNHDLFIYKVTNPLVLNRLTNTPLINEQQAFPFSTNQIAYLSDENGISNRYAARFDSAIAFVDTTIHYRNFIVSRPLTNYKRGIKEHSVTQNGKVAELVYSQGRPALYTAAPPEIFNESTKLPETNWTKQRTPSVKADPQKKTETSVSPKVKKIIVFGEDRQKNDEKKESAEQANPTAENPITLKSAGSDTFRLSRQRLYETAYYTDYLVTQLDRGFLNQTYQAYSGQAGFINPSINGLFKIGLSDLFDNYKITGGIRLSANLTGNEYLLAFQDLKNRWDKSLVFHRQGVQNNSLGGQRIMMHTVSGKISYPFSEVSRIVGSLAYRNDRTVYVSTDLANLVRKTSYNNWAVAKTEFVFDNTFPLSTNLLTGTRLKITAEHFQLVSANSKNVTVLGIDFRHYEKITRELIFASRFAAASSFGSNKLLFYLGGVDNWFIPRFDNSVSVDDSQKYLFQTLGTNVRGFYQNIRNGSSFAVINTELRWNVLKYFFKFPLRSDFLNSLQLVSFADAGTAFTGSSPYSKNNTFNKKTIVSGPIVVTLDNQQEPLVGGLGFGLRTRMLGYFVRGDLAWGIQDGKQLPPVFYLSLCTDF
jgi:hypothetical protein